MASVSFALKQTVPFDGDARELSIVRCIGCAYRSDDDHEKLRMYHRAVQICGATTASADELLDHMTALIGNKFDATSLAADAQSLLDKLYAGRVESSRDSDAYCLTTLLSACVHCTPPSDNTNTTDRSRWKVIKTWFVSRIRTRRVHHAQPGNGALDPTNS